MSDPLTAIYDARIGEGALRPDPAQRAAVGVLEDLRLRIAKPEKKALFGIFAKKKPTEGPLGLYMWGGVGRGKSMLMDLFHAALDVPARRVHFHAFMQEVHRGMGAARKRGVEDAILPVAEGIAEEARVLCFDEMQITDITDAMIVGRLFEQLFARGVFIVVTSNRVPGDLYKDGLNRALFVPFIKLLEENLIVHELVASKDYRQNRLAGAPVYFAPLSRETRAQVQSIWDDLTGGKSEGLTLHVTGREVEIPAFWGGVAKAGFMELCGRPLGAGDYLALADAVRVLILTDVPQLDSSRFNEAKRFVTLIDALYEARVKVIISAAAQPEMLYAEGAGTFEFERTASRLREMQAADWGL
jgi:cell division protein ZapE